jgi:hypothetical protein
LYGRYRGFISDVDPLVDVGKAGKHLGQGAEIGRQNKSYALHEYEILLGNPHAVRWVEVRGVPNPENFGARHVDAGVDAHGHQIFIAQVSHNGGVHPARASSGESGMFNLFDACCEPELHSLQARTLLMGMENWRSR